MPMNSSQLAILKTNLAANTATIGGVQIKDLEHTDDNAQAIVDWYNVVASPDYWVWRTSVSELEFTRGVSVDGTVWSWTTYIGRSQGERDAWARLFMGGGSGSNPSLSNVRQGVADIFSGAGGATQRTHLLTVARRKVTRGEKLFVAVATGPGNDDVANNRGNTTNPDLLGFEGFVSRNDVNGAWALP